MSDHHALDPNEGPTLWVKVRDVDTAEGFKITLSEGTDPEDPLNEVRINGHEAKRLVRHLQTFDL